MTHSDMYDIRQTEAGHEVVKIQPVVLGTFTDYDLAQMFLGALVGQEAATAIAANPLVTVSAPEVSTLEAVRIAPKTSVSPPKAVAKPSTMENLVSKAHTPPPTAVEPVVTSRALAPALDTPTDADWAKALDRIAGGEKVTTVADQTALPFGKLRSKWASAVRTGTHQKPGSDKPISGGVGSVLARGEPVRDRSDRAHENAVARMMQED